MATSKHEINFVLVYHSLLDIARWVLPSQANHAKLHDPFIVEIHPLDKHYDVYAKLAGEKPQVAIRSNQI